MGNNPQFKYILVHQTCCNQSTLFIPNEMQIQAGSAALRSGTQRSGKQRSDKQR